MALIPVEIVKNSGQVVRVSLDEHGERLAYLRTLVRREELQSVTVIKPATK